MKFTIAASALALAGSAAARPGHYGKPFDVVTIKNSPISASNGQILMNLPEGEQGATCTNKIQDTATFFMSSEGHLFLYHTGAGTLQQVYVDQTPEDKGRIGFAGYTNLPDNVEVQGWASQETGANTKLMYRGKSFLKCHDGPSDSWVLWYNQGDGVDSDLSGCEPVDIVKYEAKNPISCVYTEEK